MFFPIEDLMFNKLCYVRASSTMFMSFIMTSASVNKNIFLLLSQELLSFIMTKCFSLIKTSASLSWAFELYHDKMFHSQELLALSWQLFSLIKTSAFKSFWALSLQMFILKSFWAFSWQNVFLLSRQVLLFQDLLSFIMTNLSLSRAFELYRD